MRGYIAKKLGGSRDETPLGRAQDLIYQAFEVSDPQERIKIANEALELSGDCADAYVVLAEHARSRKETLEMYEKGVAAGERAIGPRAFREDTGRFWGLLETRPYMRAREGLAHALWSMARPEEAVGHLEDLLRLNPNDNQGVRYALASWLLCLDRDHELALLLARYDEVTAAWAYSGALLAFRQQGDRPESRQHLKTAQEQNRFVPMFLSGEEPIPPEAPDHYSLGDRNEAIFYVNGALSAWRSTPGAITWLNEVLKEPKRQTTKVDQPFRPSALSRGRLKRLPQIDDEWQVGFRPLPNWVMSEGERTLPWVVLVASRTDDVIVATKMFTEEPAAGVIWDVLVGAMERPAVGQPHRPVLIQVRHDPRWDALEPHLETIGVERQTTQDLEFLDVLLDDLSRHMTKDEPPGLLDIPRVTPELVAGFFGAAADFYRKAPWRCVGDENAIKVQSKRFESGPWYAVIMGQAGITLGLALYEDLDHLRKLWARDAFDREHSRQMVSLSVTFDFETHSHPGDLVAARRHGWEVANPEAFPSVFRKERGLTTRPPLSWELALLEGCLRAIPEFIAAHKPTDTSEQSMSVSVASRNLDFVLSWVPES